MKISVEVAASGQEIFSFGGKQLCSKYDPVKEAEAWLKAVEDKISTSSQFIVLGMGAGYHLCALRRSRPDARILVIEYEKEICQAVLRSHHLELSSVLVVNKMTVAEVLQSELLKACIRTGFTVLKTPVALQMEDEFYSELFHVLSGRSIAGIQFLLENRKEWLQSLQIEVPSMATEQISIRHLLTPDPKDASSVPVLLTKALRELVA